MPATQHFRSAFHGFNREDVVNYIEYLNNHYAAQVAQLNNQLQESKNNISNDVAIDLQAKLDAALKRCAELEAQLDLAQARCSELEAKVATHEDATNRELEAYRRAEETERKAAARANAIYVQAQTALDNATSLAEAATVDLCDVAAQTEQQLKVYQESLSATVERFRAAAATLQVGKDE